MRSWAIWYRTLLVVWGLFGLPSLVIGYGFSGGDLKVPTSDFVSFAAWLLLFLFIVSPVILWPWRTVGANEGS